MRAAARLGDDRDEPDVHGRARARGRRRRASAGRSARPRGGRCRSSICAWSTTSGDEVAMGRALDRRDRGARPLDRARLLQRGRAREVRRRLASHRRHRARRPGRLGDDHRPLQGRDQVGRRVDLLGRAREPADGAPGGARGGGDRGPRRALERAAAGVRRSSRRRRRSAPPSCVEHLRGRVAALVAARASSRSSPRCRRRASASSTRSACARRSRTAASASASASSSSAG